MTRRAFIVRPFGKKPIPTPPGQPSRTVDFEQVEAKLVAPALEALGIGGRTTGDIFSQGNIRADMFHRLLTADLVIADISIANANVFYELGIRHALQDRFTVLIKFPIPGEKPVFDIAPDRYMAYDQNDPTASVAELKKRLTHTLAENRVDSPVFLFLPDLHTPGRVDFIKLPPAFEEDVQAAETRGMDGELDTYASELLDLDLPWAPRGLIEIAQAQYRRKTWETARQTWEVIRESTPNDMLANRRLATIYQKQAKPDLVRSDQALERALHATLSPLDRAELAALSASNHKTRWLADFEHESDLQKRQVRALQSAHLPRARDTYRGAFFGCLNHYYSGINALALTAIQCALARALPAVWNALHESDETAVAALAKADQEQARLDAALQVSLDAAEAGDRWASITRADRECLVATNPARVGQQYARALTGADQLTLASLRRQLGLYLSLGLFTTNAQAALEAVDERLTTPAAGDTSPRMVIVFSGHRIDPEGSEAAGKEPRFPQRAEARARELIKSKLSQLQQEAGDPVIGYAGGASGGDILFHEVCDELGIATTLLLAGPPDKFRAASVQDGGPDWVRRFEALVVKRADRTAQLTPDLQLPRWLRTVDGFNVWQHNNLWTLHSALAHGGDKVVLVALWNHGPGQGTGGTEHMIAEVKKRGGRVEIIDARVLLE